jgi:hypothetical protein
MDALMSVVSPRRRASASWSGATCSGGEGAGPMVATKNVAIILFDGMPKYGATERACAPMCGFGN